MRHPDRRQAEHVGEAVVRQRAAEVRQDRRSACRSLPRSTRSRSAPTDDRDRAASLPSARCPTDGRGRVAKPCASRCARIAGRKPRQSQPATKRICRCAVARGGIALTGRSGLPVRNASTSSVFQPNTRSAGVKPGLAPVGVDRGTAGLAGLDVGQARDAPIPESAAAAARRRESGRAHRPATRSRAARIVPGFASSPPQLPEWCPPSRRSTTRSKFSAPREPRKIVGRFGAKRGPSEAISTSARERVARASRKSRADPGEPISSPISSSSFDVEAEPPARFEHARERGEIDRVLALVVGGAAAVPAVARRRRAPTATRPSAHWSS